MVIGAVRHAGTFALRGGTARPDDMLLCFLARGAESTVGGQAGAPPRGDCGGYSLRDRKFRGLSRRAGSGGRYLACSRAAGLNSRYPAGGPRSFEGDPCVAAIGIGRRWLPALVTIPRPRCWSFPSWPTASARASAGCGAALRSTAGQYRERATLREPLLRPWTSPSP